MATRSTARRLAAARSLAASGLANRSTASRLAAARGTTARGTATAVTADAEEPIEHLEGFRVMSRSQGETCGQGQNGEGKTNLHREGSFTNTQFRGNRGDFPLLLGRIVGTLPKALIGQSGFRCYRCYAACGLKANCRICTFFGNRTLKHCPRDPHIAYNRAGTFDATERGAISATTLRLAEAPAVACVRLARSSYASSSAAVARRNIRMPRPTAACLDQAWQ